MKINGLIVLALMFGFTNVVSAHERGAADQSVAAIKKLIEGYKKGDVKQGVETALNHLVKKGTALLRERGYKQDAQRFTQSWKSMMETRALDLGDHTPMNQWMADYYETLAQRFGENILTQLHLDDVLILNYAIPVVFKPYGNKAKFESWDMVEYRKHFVPFSGVVSYWVSLGVCFYVGAQTANPAITDNCTQIASLLRTGMEMYPAPKLSDWIFVKATHQHASAQSASRVLQKKDLEFLNEVLEQYN